MLTKNYLLLIYLIKIIQIIPILTTNINENIKCRKAGDLFIQDLIQYECSINNGLNSNNIHIPDGGGDVSFENGISLFNNNNYLVGRPVGCVPSNKTDGTVIRPGIAHISQHFRYECTNDSPNGISLKVTHCIDNEGKLVKIGEFFTQTTPENSEGKFTSVECVGNEFLAKKVVHEWANCELPKGGRLVEGDFVWQDIPVNSKRSLLQKQEIISCLREENNVKLKCTGCVATTGQELVISRYANVAGQWTQCRRFKEGCRLINVTSDYIDCEFEGKIHKHGTTFESTSRRSLYICSHGQIIKQGCFIQGQELTLVGDVKYIDGIMPALCVENDNFTMFNSLVGCDLPDGRFKRFMQVWSDDDTMKRCSWAFNSDGSIARSEINSFACLDGSEEIPLNKIVQRENGQFVKCATFESNNEQKNIGIKRSTTTNNGGNLIIRNLTRNELKELSTKKLAKQNIFEYFGVGRRALPLLSSNKAYTGGRAKANGGTAPYCADMLPFCQRLSGYCANEFSSDAFEFKGLKLHFDQFGDGQN
uniref:Abnormal cell migration protein 18-like fibronectin type I domain-containing protein n=1 Tax=Meloidogyne enterolobii TaxID=390850 RepID=A0A6V7VS42_MELEN|nr:unnamed protein product [Meloidogyne enterolobii]